MNELKVGDYIYMAYVSTNGKVKVITDRVEEIAEDGMLRIGGCEDFDTITYLMTCGYESTRLGAMLTLLSERKLSLEALEDELESQKEDIALIEEAVEAEGLPPLNVREGSVVRWVKNTNQRPENMTGGSGLHTVIGVYPGTLCIKLPGSDMLWPMGWFEVVEE